MSKLIEELKNDLGYEPKFPWMEDIIDSPVAETYVIKSRGLGITTMMVAQAVHHALRGDVVLYVTKNKYMTRYIANIAKRFVGEEAHLKGAGIIDISTGGIRVISSQHKDFTLLMESRAYDNVFIDEPDASTFGKREMNAIRATLMYATEPRIVYATAPNDAPDYLPEPNFYEYEQGNGVWVTPVFQIGWPGSNWGILRKADVTNLEDLRKYALKQNFFYRTNLFRFSEGRWAYRDGAEDKDERMQNMQVFKVNALNNTDMRPHQLIKLYYEGVAHGDKGVEKFYNNYI